MEPLEVSKDMLNLVKKLKSLNDQLIDHKTSINGTLAEIRSVYSTIISSENLTVVEVLLQLIRSITGVSRSQLHSTARDDHIVSARHIFHVLARDYTKMSLAKVGRFTNRAHATVLNSRIVVNNAKDTNDKLYISYRAIKIELDKFVMTFKITDLKED